MKKTKRFFLNGQEFVIDKVINLRNIIQYFNYNSQGYGLDGNDIFLLTYPYDISNEYILNQQFFIINFIFNNKAKKNS